MRHEEYTNAKSFNPSNLPDSIHFHPYGWTEPPPKIRTSNRYVYHIDIGVAENGRRAEYIIASTFAYKNKKNGMKYAVWKFILWSPFFSPFTPMLNRYGYLLEVQKKGWPVIHPYGWKWTESRK